MLEYSYKQEDNILKEQYAYLKRHFQKQKAGQNGQAKKVRPVEIKVKTWLPQPTYNSLG